MSLNSSQPAKIHISLFLFICAALLIFACGEKLTPSETVQAYFDAIKAQDIKAISKYIVDGDQYYEAYQKLSEAAKRQSLKQLRENLHENIEITGEEIFDDSAKVDLNFTGADYGKSGVYQITLYKVGGRWKIDPGYRK